MRRGPGRWSASRSRVSRREAGARSGRAACEPPGSADRVHRPDDCASPPTSPVTEGGQMADAAPDAPARLGGGRDHHPGGVTVVSDPAPAPRQAPDAFAGKLKRTEVQRGLFSVPGREIVQVLTEIPVGVESGWAHASGGGSGVHRRRDRPEAGAPAPCAHCPGAVSPGHRPRGRVASGCGRRPVTSRRERVASPEPDAGHDVWGDLEPGLDDLGPGPGAGSGVVDGEARHPDEAIDDGREVTAPPAEGSGPSARPGS
jgi:hypothetical protein